MAAAGLRPAGAPLLLLLLAISLIATNASEGDESGSYQSCHASCLRSGCAQLPGSTTKDCAVTCPGSSNGYQAPLALRLTQWDCRADCAYHCMWAAEAARAAAAAAPSVASQGARPFKVVKYGGKWPFIRVLGMQELASVLFSLANLLAHAHCLRRLLAAHAAFVARAGGTAAATAATAAGSVALKGSSAVVDSGSLAFSGPQYPYLWIWVLYAAASMNAWLWSSVFHTRDTRVTERLDYLVGANFLVASTSFITATRVLGLTKPRQLGLAAAVVGGALLHHYHHMLFVKFDYDRNMKVCVAAGVVQGITWLVWVMRARHPARTTMYLFLGAVHLAMLLEVLDFAPLWQLVDAHALWHAATAPLTYVWYSFVTADMAWLLGGGSTGSAGMRAELAAGAGKGSSGMGGSTSRASPHRGSKKEKQ